jgi:signal transduction histidine kinase
MLEPTKMMDETPQPALAFCASPSPCTYAVAGAVSMERMLDVCEEQRRHIARELHDELGQRLSSAKWLLADISAAAAKGDNLATQLDELRGALDDSIDSMRRISSDLRPPLLDDLGLNAAIESLARSTEKRLGIVVEVSLAQQNPDLGVTTQIAAYRIVQEALTNVGRHAHATRVSIQTRNADGWWQLTVEDNGVGIPSPEKTRRGALGLVGLRERAQLCGGRLVISRVNGGGTRLNVELPLHFDGELARTAKANTLAAVTIKAPGLVSHEQMSKPALEHELAVHEIELAMQNEELRRTQTQLAQARDRYLDLYDFAPVGYLTLDGRGVIIEANLSAAAMLNIRREFMVGSAFSCFVEPEQAAHWKQHADLAMRAGGSHRIAVTLRPKEGPAIHAQLNCTRAGHAPLLHMTLTDVSANEHAKMTHRIALSAVVASEAERQRISRELHEDLAQQLGALKMELSRLQMRDGRRHQDSDIDGMLGKLDDSLATVRRIAVDLRPPMLDDLGLNAAVDWMGSDLSQRSGHKVAVSHDATEPSLETQQSVGVFRLLQSMLAELMDEHGEQELSIDLHEDGSHLRLIVETSGSGWPMNYGARPPVDTDSMMFSKAHLLGGKLSIEQGTHHGRRIVFRMPLPQRNTHQRDHTECKTHPTPST